GMKRLALCAVLLAGPAYAAELAPDQKDAITRDLADPLAAQFRNVRQSNRHDFVVCGEMNAKNQYGGYVGFRKFWMDTDLNEYEIEPSTGYLLSAASAGCT